MLKAAIREDNYIGILNQSYTNGSSQIYGILGEMCFQLEYPSARKETRIPDKYHYDFLLDGLRIEVKSRRFTSEIPRSYSQMIFNTNEQECDYYVFISVHESLSYAWLVGYLSKHEFVLKRKPVTRGTIDDHTRTPILGDGFLVEFDSMKELHRHKNVVRLSERRK
jgi:hypothetical protein